MCRCGQAPIDQQSTGLLYWIFESPHIKKESRHPHWGICSLGGPEEIRTPDPYNANVMRSQLRYRPVSFVYVLAVRRCLECLFSLPATTVVVMYYSTKRFQCKVEVFLFAPNAAKTIWVLLAVQSINTAEAEERQISLPFFLFIPQVLQNCQCFFHQSVAAVRAANRRSRFGAVGTAVYGCPGGEIAANTVG